MKRIQVLCLGVSLALGTSAALGQDTRATIPATAIKPATPAPGIPESKPERLKAGALAPDFASLDVQGRERRLSEWKGKVVVLDFWATWCGPCVSSLPHTQEVARRYKDQGVVIIANCTSDSRKNFEKFAKANESKYRDLLLTSDPHEKGAERASSKLYGVSGIPSQFIIGRDGKVVMSLEGYEEGEVRLEAALARAGIKVDAATVAKGEEQIKEMQ